MAKPHHVIPLEEADTDTELAGALRQFIDETVRHGFLPLRVHSAIERYRPSGGDLTWYGNAGCIE